MGGLGGGGAFYAPRISHFYRCHGVSIMPSINRRDRGKQHLWGSLRGSPLFPSFFLLPLSPSLSLASKNPRSNSNFLLTSMEEKIVKPRRCSEKMFRRGKHMKLIFGILDGIHMNEFYLSEAREYFRKIG